MEITYTPSIPKVLFVGEDPPRVGYTLHFFHCLDVSKLIDLDPDFVISEDEELLQGIKNKIIPFDVLPWERFKTKYKDILYSPQINHTVTVVTEGGEDFPIPAPVNQASVIEVKITDVSLQKKAYKYPVHPLFAKVLRKESLFPLRLCRDGSIRIMPQGMNTFHILHPKNTLYKVLSYLGYSVRNTYNTSPFDLFEDIPQASLFFKKPFAIPLIEAFVNEEFMPMGKVRSIISRFGKTNSEETSLQIIRLITQKILKRGYILECSRCHRKNFYPFGVVSETFVCDRCYEKNVTPLKLPQGFKMDPILQNSLLSGSVATILTLAYLFETASESFHCTPEVYLKRGNREMEIDLFGLIDGELFIGEAKMGSLIKDRDFSPRDEFKKYEILAQQLNPKWVIFSTLKESFYDVPLSKIERFKREIKEKGIDVNVKILTAKDIFYTPSP